jgi:apolipoprotein N-acyltransferase
LAQLKQQTAEAEAAGAELSVWPEAAYPYPLPHSKRMSPRGPRRILGRPIRDGSSVKAVKGPIVFGLITMAKPERLPDGRSVRNRYNSATLLTPDGKLSAPYDKMELLWFGETVPLGRQIPWLRRQFQRSGGLVPGEEIRGLKLPRDEGAALNMAVLNCYEDTLPALGRELFAALEPNLLVNVTNDAWFIGTVEPELHMRLSVMRSIELRRDMVRAVNLGVSGWIDASGKVRLRSDSAEPGFVMATPTLRSGPPTVYARFGDVPMWLLLVAASAALVVRERRQRTQT